VFRGFIAVDIAPLPEIAKFIEELRKLNSSLKTVKLENIHLTLKFLGNVEESKIDKISEAMALSVKGIAPFRAKLKGSGVFPNLSRPRVIWLGVENADNLIRIANYLNENLQALGFEKESRAFSSHITVGRVRVLKEREKLQALIRQTKDKEFGELEISSIKLKKSVLTPKGPEYSIVKENGFT
jgi:2'-5' RNA ligase